MKTTRRYGFVLAVAAMVVGQVVGASAEKGEQGEGGRFVRTHWCDSSEGSGNDHYGGRIWVNAPEVVLHPRFTDFKQVVAQNGMALVLMEEDLTLLDGVEMLAEVWGGHQGTSHKRVTINGRNTYYFRETGTAMMNNTHQYPLIDLEVTDVVNGYNALQFACDTGRSFWGLFIVEEVALRAILKADHPYLVENRLAGFSAAVKGEAIEGKEAVLLSLDMSDEQMGMVERVDYVAYYEGYDENGDGKSLDFHGMIKQAQPYGHAGGVDVQPFELDFDTSMLLHDAPLKVKAVVHLKEHTGLSYETAASEIAWPACEAAEVVMVTAGDLPAPFASRLGREKICTLVIDQPIEKVKRAQLHLTHWDGAHRDNEHPLTLNGHPIDVIGEGHHETYYTVTEIDPGILRQGENVVKLVAETEHHSVEIFLPGPGLVLRVE